MSRFDDIIFEKRNKHYGAYFHRKRYLWHLFISVIIASILFAGSILFTQYDIFVKTNVTYQILNDSTGIFEFTNFDLAEIPIEPQKDPQVDKGNDNTFIEVAKVTGQENLELEEAKTEESIEKMMSQLQQNIEQNISDNLEETLEAHNRQSVDAHTPIIIMETELRRYIFQNTKYPDSALNNKINGVVLVQFIVTPKGDINNIAIIKNAHPILDKEALRVVKNIPKGKPVVVRGKPIPVMYRIPIVFKI